MINEFFLINFLKKHKKLINDNFSIKLSAIRNFKISKEFVGIKFSIYNGKVFIPIKITDDMVGKKFGLFSFSYNILIKKKKNKYLGKINK